jgi:hypothetical protein
MYQIIKQVLPNDKLLQFENTCKDLSFEPSYYYDASSSAYYLDSKKRCSQKCDVTEIEIKRILNTILYKHGYVFVSFHLQLIKYERGGFFVKHTDHSFGINDCTFLLCLHECVKGGETLLYTNEDIKVKQKKNDLLIFDKTLPHMGMLVLEGTKLILKGSAVKITEEPLFIVNANFHKYFIFQVNKLKHLHERYYKKWVSRKNQSCLIDKYLEKNECMETLNALATTVDSYHEGLKDSGFDEDEQVEDVDESER